MNVDEKSRPQDWDIPAIEEAFLVQFGFRAGIDVSNNGFRNYEDLAEFLKEKALSALEPKSRSLARS